MPLEPLDDAPRQCLRLPCSLPAEDAEFVPAEARRVDFPQSR
jgi:hypothetical protein